MQGLTQISNIVSSKVVDGKTVPCEGELYYRGINIEKLTQGFLSDKRFGFEETTYLLLFGKLPDKKELEEFKGHISRTEKPSQKFCERCYYEGSQPGHDEHSLQKCPYSLFL